MAAFLLSRKASFSRTKDSKECGTLHGNPTNYVLIGIFTLAVIAGAFGSSGGREPAIRVRA